MSFAKHACCCGGDGPASCPTSGNCVCATSYSLSGVGVQYSFQRFPTARNCELCGQVCYRKEYSISIAAAQLGAIVVTRRNVGDDVQQNQCCWYGAGTVRVTYDVQFQEFRECSAALNKTYAKQTFTGTIDVPCCVHVTCRSGRAVGCTQDFGNARHYVHTLDICSFPIACSDVMVAGARNAIDECGPVTCDSGANCDAGPFSLWCIGGQVSFISKYKCLDTLVFGDAACLGYYRSARCMRSCAGTDSNGEAYLPAAVNSWGPFACGLYEECDAQGGDAPCNVARMGGNFLPTTFGSPGSQPYDDLHSFCGATDLKITDACGSVDFLQTGCGINLWSYA